MEHAVDVAIIGAGISGICAAIILKKQLKDGANIIIYEKAGSLGGTWRDNVYPGSASDSVTPLYCLSSFPNNFSPGIMASQSEMLAYMNDIIDQNCLRSNIQCNTQLTSAVWDPSTHRYRLSLEDTITNETSVTTSQALVAASGILSAPRMPRVPGMGEFEGKMFHSSRWESDVDLRNRGVAVIGNGASAAQVIPGIVAVEGIKVTQFMKKPNWHLAAFSSGNPETQKRIRESRYIFRITRMSWYLLLEVVYLMVYGSDLLRPLAMKISKNYTLKAAPAKYHDMLIPDYPIGCRRIIFDTSYFESLRRDNVRLVNQPVKRMTETGVITGDGQYLDFDVIIAATGFDTHLTPLSIRGKTKTLQEYYADCGGPEAYLGTMVPGFPNLFILGGPNSATAYMPFPFLVECQMNLVLPLIRRLGSTDIDTIEVTQRASNKYNRTLRKRFRNSVWNTFAGRSYKTEESGKHTFLFPGCATLFWWWTRSPRWQDFLVNGKIYKPRRMSRLTTAIFAAMFLVIILVVVLVTLDKKHDRRLT
ncbi:hypothetical protein DFP72DRAFT_1168556 [Ephemerocybe angulata]|uniref:Flavin-containing monooxygenase n=1 Tax=Ephemerocybe angulata TaxID=980116 RepID=A0A8H6I269_9AGAR|nr:hypothetical protein DFP72DRAFT_1168556 [Tulosesus angulatus]